MSSEVRIVWVPFERLPGWCSRFDGAHPGAEWLLDAGAGSCSLAATSRDGTGVRIDVPFGVPETRSLDGVVAHLAVPRPTGVLLVRRGGYAIARLDGATVVASKVGQRHVQGRTKAGGWSQQRFARRRANQAHVAFDAAAGHAGEILGAGRPLELLGLGGDRQGVSQVLEHRELRGLGSVPRTWLESSGDPNRAALARAVERLRSLRVEIRDPGVAPAIESGGETANR